MKSRIILAVSAIFILFLSSCGGEIHSLKFDSPDGDRSIAVSGERQGSVGPIMVTVKLSVPGGDKSFQFEHQAGSLTKENCKAEWKSNVEALLTFTLDDDTQWQVDCFLNDNEVQAIKRFKIDGKGIFHH